MTDGMAVEIDLQSAASWTVSRMGDLADARTSCYKAVVALADHLQPLSQHLRRQQGGSVAKVAANIHVAFLAVATVLLNWPNTSLPSRYLTGFRSLGLMERTGVLRDIPRIDPVPIEDLLATAPAAFAALNGCVPTEDAAHFLIGECNKDLSKGFAGPLMTKDQADSRWGPGRWLRMPRFETIQASGKHRPIDDGKRFGHNSVVLQRQSGAAPPSNCWCTLGHLPSRRPCTAVRHFCFNTHWKQAVKICLKHTAGSQQIPRRVP